MQHVGKSVFQFWGTTMWWWIFDVICCRWYRTGESISTCGWQLCYTCIHLRYEDQTALCVFTFHLTNNATFLQLVFCQDCSSEAQLELCTVMFSQSSSLLTAKFLAGTARPLLQKCRSHAFDKLMSQCRWLLLFYLINRFWEMIWIPGNDLQCVCSDSAGRHIVITTDDTAQGDIRQSVPSVSAKHSFIILLGSFW